MRVMPLDAFSQLLNLVGIAHPGDDIVEIAGSDPVYDTPFKVGEASAAILAAIAVHGKGGNQGQFCPMGELELRLELGYSPRSMPAH
jgi:hypothetical protein